MRFAVTIKGISETRAERENNPQKIPDLIPAPSTCTHHKKPLRSKLDSRLFHKVHSPYYSDWITFVLSERLR